MCGFSNNVCQFEFNNLITETNILDSEINYFKKKGAIDINIPLDQQEKKN